MAALRIADYIEKLFAGTEITVKIDTDLDYLQAQYPLLAGTTGCRAH
jgi:hypothetical protein